MITVHIIAAEDEERFLADVFTFIAHADGKVDIAAPVGVPPLEVQPVLFLCIFVVLAIVKVLRHLKERDPIRQATPQPKIDSANAGVRIVKDTKLEMLLPATDPGNPIKIVLNISIISEITIKNVVWDPTKKFPRRVIIVCIISLVVFRILPETWWVREREIVFVKAIYFWNHSRIDIIDLVRGGGKSQELAVFAMPRVFLQQLSVLVRISAFNRSL